MRGHIVIGALLVWLGSGAKGQDLACPDCDQKPVLQDWRMADRAWQFHAQLLRDADKGRLRISTGDAPAIGSDSGLSLAIERNLGRKRQLREAISTPRTTVSRSMAQIGYEAAPADGGRLWVAGNLTAERRRLVLEGLRGKSLTTREASVSAGWIQDNRWQLSARYVMDRQRQPPHRLPPRAGTRRRRAAAVARRRHRRLLQPRLRPLGGRAARARSAARPARHDRCGSGRRARAHEPRADAQDRLLAMDPTARRHVVRIAAMASVLVTWAVAAAMLPARGSTPLALQPLPADSRCR